MDTKLISQNFILGVRACIGMSLGIVPVDRETKKRAIIRDDGVFVVALLATIMDVRKKGRHRIRRSS